MKLWYLIAAMIAGADFSLGAMEQHSNQQEHIVEENTMSSSIKEIITMKKELDTQDAMRKFIAECYHDFSLHYCPNKNYINLKKYPKIQQHFEVNYIHTLSAKEVIQELEQTPQAMPLVLLGELLGWYDSPEIMPYVPLFEEKFDVDKKFTQEANNDFYTMLLETLSLNSAEDLIKVVQQDCLSSKYPYYLELHPGVKARWHKGSARFYASLLNLKKKVISSQAGSANCLPCLTKK